MAVQHIVLLELKDGVSDADIDQALNAVAGLNGKVPGVLGVKAGKNFTDRAGNISHAAIVTLEDRDALAGYGPHPAHQEVAKILGGLTQNLMVVDFET